MNRRSAIGIAVFLVLVLSFSAAASFDVFLREHVLLVERAGELLYEIHLQQLPRAGEVGIIVDEGKRTLLGDTDPAFLIELAEQASWGDSDSLHLLQTMLAIPGVMLPRSDGFYPRLIETVLAASLFQAQDSEYGKVFPELLEFFVPLGTTGLIYGASTRIPPVHSGPGDDLGAMLRIASDLPRGGIDAWKLLLELGETLDIGLSAVDSRQFPDHPGVWLILSLGSQPEVTLLVYGWTPETAGR